MENESAPKKAKIPIKQTSLPLAIILALAAYLVTFCTMFYQDYGVIFSAVLFDHPAAFSEYLAGALGGSLIFPVIHVGIASFFKSKRNPSSRRNIFIGWSIAIIFIQLVLFVVAIGTPGL
jgi:hypothetical protein